MNISTHKPFCIVYSIYEHEFLGYLVEPYAVQLDNNMKPTFQHQHISNKNANEFKSIFDEKDFALLKLLEEITQESVTLRFSGKRSVKAEEYLPKIYTKPKDNELVINQINTYLENRKQTIFDLLVGKRVYEMGSDGEPTWKKLEVCADKGSVLFHFFRNDENTHYFPTIKFRGEKTEFQYKNGIILNNKPAWLLLDGKVFTFEKEVDGNKLKPFLKKKFIEIPKKLEEEYFGKFVTNLVAQFDVHAKGFDIRKEYLKPKTEIVFSELQKVHTNAPATLFDAPVTVMDEPNDDAEDTFLFQINFVYDNFKFDADAISPVSVKLEKSDDNYIFHKVIRDIDFESKILELIRSFQIKISNGKFQLTKSDGISFIQTKGEQLRNEGVELRQNQKDAKKYFIGESRINLEINENNDWFDINAKIFFGEFEIPFLTIRKYIKKGIRQFELPNGQIAVIPSEWLTQYSELFSFVEDHDGELRLQKYHVTLVNSLKEESLAEVIMSRKLEQLREFESLADEPLPQLLNGELRHYQKAGYNWLKFLNTFKFGGCLADDMGLGKTIQTLTLLLNQKEENKGTSLLICPTSLVFNWEQEAKKFAPHLKILNFTGSNRSKNIDAFSNYDLVLTSYGIVRIDSTFLQKMYFNYIILDESQAIKNPSSTIAQDVNSLKSTHKLVLTGTPIENSTLDLWSQMNFVNPGLLGTQQFFKTEFLTPIEKKKDLDKVKKLHALVKPFILRRKKNQVATELPDKIEQIVYCDMTEEQEKLYEETKSYYRNEIANNIETEGIGKSAILILQGLTKLRQIANHPAMCVDDYSQGSGKYDMVIDMHENVTQEDHKVLVFSQFVKNLAFYKEYLEKEKQTFTYIDGSTKNRKEQVDEFQNNEQVKTFLISLKAGGTGLNLTAAEYVFILDPWWNPAAEQQAIDRAYRIGQKNNVFVYKFITRNTVEEKILLLQQKKKDLADNLISADDSFIKTLTKEDIDNIFG
ncbi:MAG: SNF2-related protein [Cytophagales bacterium]